MYNESIRAVFPPSVQNIVFVYKKPIQVNCKVRVAACSHLFLFRFSSFAYRCMRDLATFLSQWIINILYYGKNKRVNHWRFAKTSVPKSFRMEGEGWMGSAEPWVDSSLLYRSDDAEAYGRTSFESDITRKWDGKQPAVCLKDTFFLL